MVFKDIDGNRRTLADFGVTYMSAERIAELGLTEVDEDYKPELTADELKTAELDKALQVYTDSLNKAKDKILTNMLTVSTDNTKITAAQAAFTKAKTDYQAERAAIIEKYANA